MKRKIRFNLEFCTTFYDDCMSKAEIEKTVRIMKRHIRDAMDEQFNFIGITCEGDQTAGKMSHPKIGHSFYDKD